MENETNKMKAQEIINDIERENKTLHSKEEFKKMFYKDVESVCSNCEGGKNLIRGLECFDCGNKKVKYYKKDKENAQKIINESEINEQDRADLNLSKCLRELRR